MTWRFAVSEKSLYEPWTTSLSMYTESPAPSSTRSSFRYCTIFPRRTMIISSWSGCLWNACDAPGDSVTSITTKVAQPVEGGSQRMPALPQSNCVTATSSCSTNLLIGLLLRSSDGDRLEAAHVLGHRDLGGQALHRGGAEEAGDPLGALDDVGGVVRLGDRAAVAEDEDVGAHPSRRVVHLLDQGHAVVERLRRLGADRAAGGQAHVRDEDVGARLRHRDRLVDREGVRRGEHVLGACEPDEVDLEAVAHPGLLEVLPERAVEEPHGREVLHARESDPPQLVEEDVHAPERIGAAHAREHRRLV